ncbi:MAG TPA: flavin reductase family protein [Acidobacteriota bacterium]|nr:flavin reductase family protein [Acidobacteriota bacterium]
MPARKVKVNPSRAYRLIHPMHTVLVSCKGKNRNSDIITLAWVMPTSIDPPLLAVSIAPRRHSYKLIEETKEFVVNIPTMDILNQTLFCGRRSGKTCNKFKETGLTASRARKVKPPIIKECIAHLECKLHSEIVTGDHTIFVGEIVEAYADKEAFTDEYDLKKARMIFHLGANDFATLNPKVFRLKLKSER